jgi:hypothetical protein
MSIFWLAIHISAAFSIVNVEPSALSSTISVRIIPVLVLRLSAAAAEPEPEPEEVEPEIPKETLCEVPIRLQLDRFYGFELESLFHSM